MGTPRRSPRAASRGQLALALLLLSGCMYRFTAVGGELPHGIRSVRAPIFENSTNEAGAEVLFTQALREQLDRVGKLNDGADDTVRGVLTSISSGPLVSTPGRLPNYRLSASARLAIVSGGKEVVVSEIAGSEDFPPGADLLLTEANRGAALRRLADAMMRDGYERLCSGF